jgi:ABC-type cobalamin/Fe3+-siderophores transport system ATPase subunit
MPQGKRKALNSYLSPLISTSSGQNYILVGPRGSGKSTAIEHTCQGKEGVARIRVDKSNVNVFELVAEAFGVNSSYNSLKKQDDLVKLFRQASAKLGGSWVQTIIAEVDRGIDTTIIFKYKIKLLWS